MCVCVCVCVCYDAIIIVLMYLLCSQGEGAKRCLWLKKRAHGAAAQATDCDELLCKGYVALQGPSGAYTCVYGFEAFLIN